MLGLILNESARAPSNLHFVQCNWRSQPSEGERKSDGMFHLSGVVVVLSMQIAVLSLGLWFEID